MSFICYSPSEIDGAGATETLVEHWNGVSWSIEKTSNPKSAVDNQLLAVACPSMTTCLAVGVSSLLDGDSKTLAERLSSGSWSTITSANVSGAIGNALTGVACAGKLNCVASGYSVNRKGDVTLLQQWSGASWSTITSGKVVGDYATGLNGVACTSKNVCAAVGSGPDGFGQDDALVEQD